jgi:5-methylcytosine-specific restriction endonuclease McrA
MLRVTFEILPGGYAPASPQCDHVVPITRGGKSTLDNLVTSCKRCNSSKKGKTAEEWRRSCQ